MMTDWKQNISKLVDIVTKVIELAFFKVFFRRVEENETLIAVQLPSINAFMSPASIHQ